MGTGPLSHRTSDSKCSSPFLQRTDSDAKDRDLGYVGPNWEPKFSEETRGGRHRPGITRQHATQAQPHIVSSWRGLSPWSRSALKRIFDVACVLLSLPIVFPLMVAIGAAVRLTSVGSVFFLQQRVGLRGRIFTIFKFRTMTHLAGEFHDPIAILDSRYVTPVGLFLRRWKLDELPQLINVLLGHMSLVGPRPKMQEHIQFDLPCRPGITGMATTVFACEEKMLARVPTEELETYFHSVILPAKRHLDAEYMARATFGSDLCILVNSVLRRWDTGAFSEFVESTVLASKDGATQEHKSKAPD